MGKIISINISSEKHLKKQSIQKGVMIENFGLKGDAHAGDKIRQISLLDVESINKIKNKLPDIKFGDFAENLTTEGIDFSKIKVGDKLKIGKSIILEVTQIGKECHSRCEIYKQVGDCIMPREGIFAKVICGGDIKIGDEIKII